MTPQKTQSRAPLMLAMAAILALPMALTAGIGIYRAEREPARRPVAEHPAPATPPTGAPDADRANSER